MMWPSILRGSASCVITVWLATCPVVAQQNQGQMFERAKMLDDSNQRPTEAIKLYNQVVANEKNDRTRAATALHRIGVIYLRSGRANEAARAFKTVITHFPDQTVLVARAKAKLAELASRVKTTTEVNITTARAPDHSPLHVTYKLPAGWFFTRAAIDQSARRLYTFASRLRPLGNDPDSRRAARRGLRLVFEPSTLVVIDLDTSSIVKTVPFRFFLGEVALNPMSRSLYAAAPADGCVKVIDTRTLSEKASIRLEGFPAGVAVNPITNRVYATCQGFAGNDKMFVIDAGTNTVLARVDLEGIGSKVVVNTATNRVYTTVGAPAKIRIFDGETNEATEDLPGLSVSAADSLNNRIYAAVIREGGPTDELRVLDGATHRTLAKLFAGQHGISDVALDLDGNLAYVCLNAQNQLAVVDTMGFTEVSREWLYGPISVAIDPVKRRFYLAHTAHQDGPHVLDVADASSLATQASKEFSEDFESSAMAPEWTVFKGRGAVSLSDAVGKLRFRVQPRTIPDQSMVLARQFTGDRWEIEFKVSYATGTTGGTRAFAFTIGFGVPEILRGPPPVASIRVSRARGDWNGCCPGLTSVSLGSRCLTPPEYEAPINATETYIWRITRNRRHVVVERSDDGVNFSEVATHVFGAEIDGMIQYLSITGDSHANDDAYADYEYIRLTRLARD